MLLAAGVLSALAFAALPALASADEFQAHCEGAATCTGEITGGVAELRNSGGEVIKCTGLTGSTGFTSTTTTGTASFIFTGCREQVTIFKFQCRTPGSTNNGEITVNNLTYHVINLEHTPTTKPGIKFTNVSVTFTCAGFSDKTVTGSVVGTIEESNTVCEHEMSTMAVTFEESATQGTQKWTQTETTGTKTDLISNNDAGGAYSTSAQVGTGIIHWNHPVRVTC